MKEKFINPIIKENPVFVLTIGMCPTLAITTTLENAYVMGISVILVLLLATIITHIFKPLITEKIRIPAYIVIIASLVTILELLMSKFIPDIHNVLGIYVALIVVHCIILGSILNYAKEKNFKKNIISSLGTGVGFTFALSVLAIIREFLGNNTITIIDSLSEITGKKVILNILPENNVLPIETFLTPAGAFLSLGLIIALVDYLRRKKEAQNGTI